MSVSSAQVPVVPLSTTVDLAAVRAGRVRAVGRARAVQAQVLDAGTDEADVVGVDLGRVVAVVPGETGVLRHARGAAGRAAAAQEVVRLGEQGERRGPRRVGVDHVQDRLFGGVGQVVRDVLGAARVRVGGGQPGHVMLQRAYRRDIRPGIAGHVELRRGVGLQGERGGVGLLGGQQAGHVAGQLAEGARGVGAQHIRGHGVAGDGRAVAVGRRGRDGAAHVGAGLVVALVGAQHEQGVGRRDPVRGQPLEERAEGLVVVLRLRDVAGVTAAERGRGARAARTGRGCPRCRGGRRCSR